ncbi:hypothetical protein [Novosphingopyxis sp.]|uniref:hypothetical protein n=1 Tax=Novosphingopyxis sp. TaxID=2709690 RepID=UPI003B5CCA53
MELFSWNPWAPVAAIALIVLLISILGDHRRRKRRNLEQTGFMPWPFITVMSAIVFLFGTALAIQLG